MTGFFGINNAMNSGMNLMRKIRTGNNNADIELKEINLFNRFLP